MFLFQKSVVKYLKEKSHFLQFSVFCLATLACYETEIKTKRSQDFWKNSPTFCKVNKSVISANYTLPRVTLSAVLRFLSGKQERM